MKIPALLIAISAFSLSSLLISNSAQAAQDNQTDKKAIAAIVETFRISLINKDKETFKSLFYSNDIPWIAVFSDEMVNAKRTKKPDYPRTANFGKFGAPEKMISDTEQQEEKMWNIKIDTDGYLGTVHFNYSDHINGYKRAWGTEAWDLVKEDAGWKIVSVKFVVTENPEPAPEKAVEQSTL